MWPALESIREQLTALQHYIAGLEQQDALLGLAPESCAAAEAMLAVLSLHWRSGGAKAEYEYNTVIVSLYGHFERFVEDVVEQYVARLSNLIPNYSDLPERLRQRHVTLSLELAQKAERPRYANAFRVEELVERLHRCFAAPEHYELNAVAFTQHTSNVRHPVITAMLLDCGVSDLAQAVKDAEPFRTFLKNEDPDRDVELYLHLGDDIVFFRLTDLAYRRNDVAHGARSGETLSRDLLRSRIDFVEAYAEAMALVLFERTLPFVTSLAATLGPPIAVFANRVVAIALSDGEVTVGDMLIAKTQDPTRPFKGGPIESIERDHVACHRVDGGPDVKVGMAVNFGAKQNHVFYHVSKAKFDGGKPVA